MRVKDRILLGIITGVVASLGIAVRHKKKQTPFISVIDHIIFGASCGYLASKLSDGTLFPDEKNLPPRVANQLKRDKQEVQQSWQAHQATSNLTELMDSLEWPI
jgi:hypothetical protein